MFNLKINNSLVTANMNVHAVVPGMGDTFPLVALHAYSPASDSCKSDRLRMDCVALPITPSCPVMVLLFVMFCRTIPSLSQTMSGGGEPTASQVSSNWGVDSTNDRTAPLKSADREPFSLLVILMILALTAFIEQSIQQWILLL